MTIDSNTGLVLEGGAMRGIYTAGVLDVFLDKNIKIKDCFYAVLNYYICNSFFTFQ